ncbi:MAG: M48 family metallopeptidase [Candidatus Obscuribacterales bacterium]|nr:M48 family metallopeptidase [Candidatus Obscuribacterales bacterium]
MSSKKMMIIFLFAALLFYAAVYLSADANPNFEYPKCTEAMRQYFAQRYFITICSPLWAACVMFLCLQTGMVAKLRDSFSGLKNYIPRLLLSVFSIYILGYLIKLPFIFYSSYVLEHNFGLSPQSFPAWAKEQFGFFAVGLFIVPFVAICFLLVRRYQHSWFIPVWILTSITAVFVAFVEPVVIEPLFNHFQPLPESSLRQSIKALSTKLELPNLEILVADKSKQTKKINAYVNGVASTKRIVLYDTLVKDVPEDEVLAVVAHELGHYKLKHVLIGLAIAIAGMLPLFYAAQILSDKYIAKLPRSWGIKSSSDPALFAVYCLIIWIGPLFIAPIPSFISRMFESEADAYAIRVTQNPLAAAKAFAMLSEKNISDPDPPAFIEFWFFSHPSIKHRIDYALSQRVAGKEN